MYAVFVRLRLTEENSDLGDKLIDLYEECQGVHYGSITPSSILGDAFFTFRVRARAKSFSRGAKKLSGIIDTDIEKL